MKIILNMLRVIPIHELVSQRREINQECQKYHGYSRS